MRKLIRKWSFDLFALALLITAMVLAGCTSPSAKVGKAPTAGSPDVETRTYDIRDLINAKPDFSNAPDFTLSHPGAQNNPTTQLMGPRGMAFGGGLNRGTAQPPVPLSSLPNPSEELWIISKPKARPAAVDDEQLPRSGALVVKQDDKVLPFPLKHTDVKAQVDGYIASVNVTQQYHNPFAEKIEAVYVFPLPENAAVNEFVMTIGDRVVRGIIREKEEARQIYQDAKQQGYVASLLEQDRPNVFTQKVANIEPGKQVDIGIRYFHTLSYVDGWYEFAFPMVVGPRFNPPHTTDGIGASARGEAGTSGQKTEVQYLSPGERTGHEVSLRVDIAAGVAIEQVDSVNHAIDIAFADQTRAAVSIRESDRIPNKDFVLRYKVAGETLKSAIIAQKDPRGGGGYFTLMLYPPATTQNLPRRPVDLCFTLDVSGSMIGAPIEQSRWAMRAAMDMMQPDDTFQIIRFASNADQLSDAPLQATKSNIAKARKFIENTSAGGGTMMLEGITRSLNQTVDEDRVRYVCMMTDGYIGNERQIIQTTRKLRGQTRVFGFGVGSSPNRYLLDGMSRAGAGAVAYLSLQEKGEDVMRPFFERISRPAMTNIEIDASGLQGAQINPFKIGDVYVGRATIVTGRFEGDGGSIVVRGRVGGEAVERTFDVRPTETGGAIASVWARQQIAALCDQAMFDDAEIDLAKEVKQIALNYSLMSDYTSFVAVDSTRRTDGSYGTTVIQPVPVPDGVKYETTVPEKAVGTVGERR